LKTYKGSYAVLRPFAQWESGHSLSWYQDYRVVKHNRESQFHKASIGNVTMAASALAAILFAQFHDHIFMIHDMPTIINGIGDYISINDALICIKPPKWNDEEIYSFDWMQIKNEERPFTQYPFNV